MKARTSEPRAAAATQMKLIDSAISVIRRKGYAATSVDELCAAAAVTKGAFFHYFPTKAALAVSATHHWSLTSREFFANAPYHRFEDPVDRLLGYLDFRKSMLGCEVAEFSCLAGTLVQEVYESHPDIRSACADCIGEHAAELEADITLAMKRYRVRVSWSAKSLALHTQAVLQGAFVLAKAQDEGGGDLAVASVDHLRRYLEMIFRPSALRRRRTVLPAKSARKRH